MFISLSVLRDIIEIRHVDLVVGVIAEQLYSTVIIDPSVAGVLIFIFLRKK